MAEKSDMPKILINSVPKSGTNLLLQIIQGIPGLRRVEEPALLQLKNGQFVTGHLAYSKELSNKLKSDSIKQVFIYRDLRDVTVSLRHFINNKIPEHPLFTVFKNRLVTKEQQLDALISGIDFIGDEKKNTWGLDCYPGIYVELQRTYQWINDPSVCSMRYEDLMGTEKSREEILTKIIDYLWEDSTNMKIEKDQLLSSMKQNIQPEKSWTFRKGKIGSWKEEFNEEHKEAFKRIAGDLLIQLGYEKDYNW